MPATPPTGAKTEISSCSHILTIFLARNYTSLRLRRVYKVAFRSRVEAMASPLSCATVRPFSAFKPVFMRSSCHQNASMEVEKAPAYERPSVQPAAATAEMVLSRRLQLATLLAAAGVAQQPQAAQAIG